MGERPGLSVADSLGVYLTFGPRLGRRDSERNCISNIHGQGGLSAQQAAAKLVWLARQAFTRGLTGVELKEEAGAAQVQLGDPELLPVDPRRLTLSPQAGRGQG
jgi:ethanolamine ammonia-lyase small subunit